MALRCAGLCKRFGDLDVVRHVDLDAAEGEVLALLGPSGCGKTTTLRLIAGLEALDAGCIEVAGNIVADGDCHIPPERRRIGMVFQDYALFPHMTVAKNVAFGLSGGRGCKRRVAEMLDVVSLRDVADRMPHELSGGQQQRVALARALAPGPSILLLDEPFSNLDPGLRITLRREVRRILDAVGTTAVIVTHDQEEALSLADRVAVMAEGHIVQVGTPEELYHRPVNRGIAEFVGDAQFLPGVASGGVVKTELGSLPVANRNVIGEVDVLLRPEVVQLIPEGDAIATNAEIVFREFYGRYQLITVRLDNGRFLIARVDPHRSIRRGERAEVRIREAVQCFPRTDAPEHPLP